jgi:hypothetical protein
MRNTCTVQIIQSFHQVPEHSVELLHAPVPMVAATVLDDLGETGVEGFEYKDMAVGLLHLDAGLHYKVVLQSGQKAGVELTDCLCKVRLADDVGVHVALVVGEGTNEQSLPLSPGGGGLEHPSLAHFSIVDDALDHDIFRLGVEGLLQILVDMCLQRDVFLEGFADCYDVGPAATVALAEEFSEPAEGRDVFGWGQRVCGSEGGLADGASLNLRVGSTHRYDLNVRYMAHSINAFSRNLNLV